MRLLRLDQARVIARRLAAAGKPISRRALLKGIYFKLPSARWPQVKLERHRL